MSYMSYKSLLVVTLTFCSLSLFAQKGPIKDARKAFSGRNYAVAVEECEKAYNKIPYKAGKSKEYKAEMAYCVAESYRLTEQHEAAKEWYERAIDLGFAKTDPKVHFNYGETHRFTGDYDKAKEQYQEYLELVPGDKAAEDAIKSCEQAPITVALAKKVTIKPEEKINDKASDMALVIADRRGDKIMFSSARAESLGKDIDPRSGEKYYDIFYSELDKNGNYREVTPVEDDSINTEHHEATVAFDGRYKQMFFTRCYNPDDNFFGCDIFVSQAKGKSWDIPEKINLKPNDTISVGHPCPSEDGRFLIFASDMPGGFGGKDLWYTEYDRRSDSWSDPVNMGPEINTAQDELFPTFGLNGELFFASSGHVGLGGMDIFVAKRVGTEYKWAAPENMGYPFNSKDNDFHLTQVDEKRGYFTSDRKKGSNATNIYSYEIPPNLFTLKVVVSKLGSSEKVNGASVEITTAEGTFTGVTNESGMVYWEKKPNGDRYIGEEGDFKVKLLPLEGYHDNPQMVEFTTKGLPDNQDFYFAMNMVPKTPIRLPEVRYELGSAKLMVIQDSINSKDSLNFVYDMLEEYPGMVIRLVSHTDSRGSASANEKLAQARAQSCVDYLVNEKGVPRERLVPEGAGENEPRTVYLVNGNYVVDKPEMGTVYEEVLLTESYINKFKKSNPTLFEKLHQFNRRTEGKVVSMDYVAGGTTSAE